MENIRLKDGFTDEKIIICPQNIIEQFKNIPMFNNLLISDIGFFPKAKFHYRERERGVDEYILILCVNGEGKVKFNDKLFSLSENNLIIIPKNTKHLYFSDNTNPWDILWVHFNGEYTNYFFNNYKFESVIQCTLDCFRIINIVFADILTTLQNGLTQNNLVFASQSLSYILSLILLNNTVDTSKHNSKAKYIDDAVMYMKENINKFLSLDNISQAIGLSRSHTSLLFKEETGYSPIEFFNRLKIQSSCSLLKYSDIPIKEVACRIGYSDQYYFSRVFKKIMNVSPLHYRNENNIKH